MSICSLCVHSDACQAWVRHGKALYEDFEYSTDNCPQFTNNYNIVEVVRCWQCKHSKEYKCKVDPMRNHLVCFRREHYSCPVEEDDFCSYGERRTT